MPDNLMPPLWAESLLRLILPADDRDTVSGDLLEAYRDTEVPARGLAGADRWYVGQVFGFAWRSLGVWVALFAAAQVARTALDWFVPVSDFGARSEWSTAIAAATLLLAGLVVAWRTRSLAAAAFSGASIAVLAAATTAIVTLLMFAVWHDPMTTAHIDASGGLGEALTMPAMLVLPGLLLGLAGGVVGRKARTVIGHR